MEQLGKEYAGSSTYPFETAQYYARKCDYQKAIDHYELSFAKNPRRPRYQDELMGIADLYEIQGKYQQAVKTCDRIIKLPKNEWGLAEETALKTAENEKNGCWPRHKQADLCFPCFLGFTQTGIHYIISGHTFD